MYILCLLGLAPDGTVRTTGNRRRGRGDAPRATFYLVTSLQGMTGHCRGPKGGDWSQSCPEAKAVKKAAAEQLQGLAKQTAKEEC